MDEDRLLLSQMRRVVELYPRYGSERVHGLLNSDGLLGGWRVNCKRVHRLWKREHLQVPTKQRKMRRLPGSTESSSVRRCPRHRNHVWSYDFVMDRTEDGRQIRLLAIIDEYTRECMVIKVARSFTARDVILTLQYQPAVPQQIHSENGPEFIA